MTRATHAAHPTIPPAPSEGRAVLQVVPRLDSGGVERGTLEVAAGLVAAGWRAVVVSAGGRMVPELEALGATHIPLPVATKHPWRIRRNAHHLADVIREHQIALVHARSRAPAFSARAATRATGRPLVTTYHGTYNRGPWGIKHAYNGIMARGDHVIAISHFIADHLRQYYPVPPERLTIIPRGVAVETFDPARVSVDASAAQRAAWGVPATAPLVLLPGRLTRWKGQTVLIRALAALTKHPNTHGVLLGDDQGRHRYRAELMALIRALGLTDRVHLAPHHADMPTALAAADVVVSASTEPEAFGRVAVEAQAMARPIIATDHGGARETVCPGETGWLVPPGDAPALAQALTEVLALPPEDRATLGARGRAHVQRYFTTATMVSQTLAVYDRLVPVSPKD